MRTICSLLLLLCAGTIGCGGDSTGPSAAYDNIAGTYNGALIGLSQGIALNSTFSITIAEASGATSGSWGLSGTLSDGVNTVNVAGTGTLTGTIDSGNNPSVSITIKTAACPNYQAHFSGTNDSINHRLTISGPVEFFASNSCSVVLTYNATIVLNH